MAVLLESSTPCLAEVPKFNNTKCPAFWELQAPHVAAGFRLEYMEGYFYELAFHDVTQFPFCLSPPRCITSSKALETYPDGVRLVNDTWALNCFGHSYPVRLLFNATEHPGFLLGYLPAAQFPFLLKEFLKKALFPDTIVDYKTGPDGWVLEMQCVEWMEHVIFVGINYYSKTQTEAAFQEIDAAARARGLGFWLDQGFGLKRVDHSNCPGEPHANEHAVLI